ncbi:MAG TPA: LAGLIDADG family homing endonuclease, partial [Candidatus Nanoarchaeia archaeon]|nr:LAGLIDADG family homing endonuclease [Candidatus Nanoarchaeia archaeon]
QHLAEEQGTASNIKYASTRKNVQAALEKMIQHLRLYPKTPPHGLAAFAGNVAATEGKQDFRAWSIEPPLPLNVRIYRCDKIFVTDVLEEMLVEHQVYGLVVLDRRDAILALLRGKTITVLQKTHSEVPGKFKAGGQCLVKETLIQSCDGNILQIKDSHNPLALKSMVMNDLSLSDSPITDRWDVKKSQIYKIITRYPRLEVQASKDHVFFVNTPEGIKEKSAQKLQKGDYLIMPEYIKVEGEVHTIPAVQYYNSFKISKQGQEFLFKKREEKGLLQRELAKQLEITQTTISSYEIGKINAQRASLQKLCVALGIDFYDFLNKYTSPYLYQIIQLPVLLDEKLAQFLGYFVGDGCLEKDRVTFFEQNKQVALAYKQIFDHYFSLSSTYKFRESKNYHQLRFTSRPLVRLIQAEFPEIKKTLDTTIPEKILTSPNKILAAFLRGLFDAEGYVSQRKQVAMGINNKLLAQQVQLVLLRFGIIGSLHEYDNRRNKYSKNPRFTVDITEKISLESFQQNIGFTSTKKSEKLIHHINDKTLKSNVRKILVPGREIRKIVEAAGYNLRLFPKVTNFFRNERMMSKEVFKHSILNNIKDEKLYHNLKEIYNYPFLPVKIESITQREESVEMVDISVGNQNFIANGVIVHNSAQRFARLREGAYKDHFKKICDYMKDQFLPLGNNLKGIIVGGPGTTVQDFLGHDYLTGELKRKIIGTKDLSYTEEFGLQELLDKSDDLLAEEEVAQEKKTMQQFFRQFIDFPKKITYGEKETLKALEMNAVDLLLISENIPEEKIVALEEKALAGGATVRIISTETREGVQLRDLGGIAAILRFEIE